MTLPTPIKIVPADIFEPHQITLKDDNWKKIYTKTPNRDIAFLKIRNTSTSDSIYIANSDNVGDTDRDELAAGAMMEEWFNPEQIYAKRGGSSDITVIITVYYYAEAE